MPIVVLNIVKNLKHDIKDSSLLSEWHIEFYSSVRMSTPNLFEHLTIEIIIDHVNNYILSDFRKENNNIMQNNIKNIEAAGEAAESLKKTTFFWVNAEITGEEAVISR